MAEGNPWIKSKDSRDRLPRHAQAALCRLVCVPLANSATISRLKTGMSCGPRLVTMLRSTTAASSTTPAPALRRSVRIDGHEVMRRATRRPDLDDRPGTVKDRGDRLVRVEEMPHERHRSLAHPQHIRIDDTSWQ